jgi:hypothetical protein
MVFLQHISNYGKDNEEVINAWRNKVYW